MTNLEKYNQDVEIAERAIELIHLGEIKMLIPNLFWNSTLINVSDLTKGMYYGNMGKKIMIKYNLIFLAYVILSIFLSPYAWYITLSCIVVSLYVINKFRANSLKKCIQTVALDGPHGFIDAWNKKLISLKSESLGKIYISGFDDWRELIKKIDVIK